LQGTIDVSSRLNSSGDYEYAVQVHLRETAGVASVVTDGWAIADVNGDGGPMGPFGPLVRISGRDAWTGDDNRIGPHGTLTSKPFVLRDEAPDRYAVQILVEVSYSVGPSTERWLSLSAPTPPHPQPPSTAAVRFDGTVRDSATQEPLSDVLVRVATGPDAGRQARTDAAGKFTFEAVRTGRFGLELVKTGYMTLRPSVFLLDHDTKDFSLVKDAAVSRKIAR
jgi:hypothetical protein